MTRRFRIKVGDKVFQVEVEEIYEEPKAAVPSPPVPASPALVQAAPPTGETVELGVIRAPLPGNVISLKCREGDAVQRGDPLLVLESMKMENTILASKPGVVKRIAVTEKSPVNYGDTLVIIE